MWLGQRFGTYVRSPLLVAFALLVGLVVVGAAGDARSSQALDIRSDPAPIGRDGEAIPELGYVALSDGIRVRLVGSEVVTHDRSKRRIVEVEIEIENSSDVARRFPKQAFALELTDGRTVVSERTTQDGEESRLVIGPNSRMVGTVFFGLQGYDRAPQSFVMLDPLSPADELANLSLETEVAVN